jgi:2-amino-4-hydroxy-6-hydroxymethyldihydropteridine diphosphokinase
MAKVLLSLGANIGNPNKQLNDVISKLREQFPKLKQSSIYETEPVRANPDLNFLNMGVSFDTVLSPISLLDLLMSIENNVGRIRTKGIMNEPRLIDIDIIYFGDFISNTSKLNIPHPRAHERRFVLEPLAEIEPEFIDPIHGISIALLLSRCSDTHWVKKQADALMDVA